MKIRCKAWKACDDMPFLVEIIDFKVCDNWDEVLEFMRENTKKGFICTIYKVSDVF